MANAQRDVIGLNLLQDVTEMTLPGEKLAKDMNQRQPEQASLAPPVEKLPIELIRRIFVLSAFDFGTVTLPHIKNFVPPQISFSHVCQTWRRIALGTHELWNKVRIPEWKCYLDIEVMGLYRQWASRAGNAPITLKLNALSLEVNALSVEVDALASVFYAFLPLFRPRRLVLNLWCTQLSSLINLPADLHDLPYLEELKFIISGPKTEVKRVPLFVSKTRSISVRHALIFDAERVALPWSQLRCLECTKTSMYISSCMRIVRHTPQLEKCCLIVTFIDNPDSPDIITMPNMRDFRLDFKYRLHTFGFPIDKLISLFVLPNLSRLDLVGHAFWTNETYETLLRQFNFRQLRDVCLEYGYFYPLSRVFADAPLLRSLAVSELAILNEEAINGLATGRLGRALEVLEIFCEAGEVDGVLNMVEMRQMNARKSIENARHWQEVITLLKSVSIEIKKSQEFINNHEDYELRLRDLNKQLSLNIILSQ